MRRRVIALRLARPGRCRGDVGGGSRADTSARCTQKQTRARRAQKVLPLLEARDVCSAALTCRTLREAASIDEPLWSVLCRRRWADKQRPCSQRHSAAGESWREAFIREEREARRKVITEHDLTSRAWRFSFRCDHEQVFAPASRAGGLTCAFREEGFRSSVKGAPSQRRPLKWRLQPSSPSANDQSVGAPLTVRVGSYPPLQVARRPDNWSWVLSNNFVRIESTSSVAGAA